MPPSAPATSSGISVPPSSAVVVVSMIVCMIHRCAQ